MIRSGQPKLWSLIEAGVNTLIGFFSAYLFQKLMFHILGITVSEAAQWINTIAFTILSVIRGYSVRRAFNWWHHSSYYHKLIHWWNHSKLAPSHFIIMDRRDENNKN